MQRNRMTPNQAATTTARELGRSPTERGTARLAADLNKETTVNESGHTPKGWDMIVDHNDNIQVIDDRERVVCTVTEDDEHNFGSEKVEANARLIAAAPALLEACKVFDDAWTGGEEGDWRGALDHALSLVRAAIAKATKGGEA